MIPTKNRIGRNRTVDRVKRNGVAVHSKNFVVVCKDRDEPMVFHDEPRFAFVLSTNVSKLAVHRVRISRVLKETVRRSMRQFPGKIDYVFIARPSIAKLTSEEMMHEAEDFIRSFARRLERKRSFLEKKSYIKNTQSE